MASLLSLDWSECLSRLQSLPFPLNVSPPRHIAEVSFVMMATRFLTDALAFSFFGESSVLWAGIQIWRRKVIRQALFLG